MPAAVAEVVWYNEDTATPLTVSKPAGFAAGEILLAVIVQHAPSSQLGDMTVPSGWTEKGSYSQTDNQGKIFTIPHSGGLPSTWDFPYYINADVVLCLLRVSGADLTPTLVIGSTTFASLASSNDSPSITPTGPDDLLLCFLADICSGTVLSESDPSDMTDLGQSQASTSFMAMAGASQQLASGSATGVRTWSSVIPTGQPGATLSIAVKSTPAPVVGGSFRATVPRHLLLRLLAARAVTLRGDSIASSQYTDLIGLTDNAGLEAFRLVAATDSAGLTDAIANAPAMERTDNAGLTDSAELNQSKELTDPVGLTDTSTLDVTKSVTDSVGLTDTSTVQATKLVTHTDPVGLTDTSAPTIASQHTDSAGLTDGSALTLAHTDSAGLTDTSVVLPIRLLTATDSAGLTDGFTTQAGTGTILLPPGLIPVRSLSTAEILTRNRSTRFRFDLFSKTEAALGNLDGVERGSVDFTSSASVHSGGALEVLDTGQTVDWLNDRVKPVAIIEGLPEIPLGMFLFSEAPEEWADTGRMWSVKLLDKTTILDQDAVDGTYSLDAATVITTAVATLIASTGETNIAITPSTATLAAPLAWEAGTTKLRIVNDLLSTAGYLSLFCDGNGQFRGEPYVRPAARPIRYEFLDGNTSIYSPDFVKDVDLFSIPNKFVAVGQGGAATAALTGVATNTDPNSPYSFAARGRWIVKTATGVEAANQTVLNDYARRRLIELTSPTSSITVKHGLVPDLTFNNAVRLRRVPAGVDARHVITKMVIALDPTALVTSTLVQVIDL